MDIQALSTISQRLAEAFHSNEEALALIPDYLTEFTSISSKQSFELSSMLWVTGTLPSKVSNFLFSLYFYS